jgi:hypothetical protein
MLECLPSKCKALDSIPCTAKERRKKERNKERKEGREEGKKERKKATFAALELEGDLIKRRYSWRHI